MFEKELADNPLGNSTGPDYHQVLLASDVFGPDHAEFAALREIVSKALSAKDQVSLKLAEQVEEIYPGDRFGMIKFQHMRDLGREVPEVANQAGFNPEQALLLLFVTESHDLGRHQETINRMVTCRSGYRHGYLSVDIMNKEGLLKNFSDRHAAIIRFAAFYHAERDVPHSLEGVSEDLQPWFDAMQPEDVAFARKLCYLLRARDKIEDLRKPYLEADFALEQIKKHYLNDEERDLLRKAVFDNLCLYQMEKLLAGEADIIPTKPPTMSDDQFRLMRKIKNIMTDGLKPESLQDALEGKTIKITDVPYSYANYMLAGVCHAFDITEVSYLKEILDHGLLRKKLAFVASRSVGDQYEKLANKLASYFAEHLDPPFEAARLKDVFISAAGH